MRVMFSNGSSYRNRSQNHPITSCCDVFHQEQKKKKEINIYFRFKDSSVFCLIPFIQFMCISVEGHR